MESKEKYVVIGGQFYYHCYGVTDTLLKAKRLASKNAEYWGGNGDPHYPSIYLESNTEEVFDKQHNIKIRIPIKLSSPYLVRDEDGWYEFSNRFYR